MEDDAVVLRFLEVVKAQWINIDCSPHDIPLGGHECPNKNTNNSARFDCPFAKKLIQTNADRVGFILVNLAIGLGLRFLFLHVVKVGFHFRGIICGEVVSG